MSEQLEHTREFVKKHWVAVSIGLVGVFIIYRYMGASSAPAANSNLASAAALQAAYAQSAQANVGNQLAAQTESDQANLAAQKLADATQIAGQQNQVALTTAVGQNVSALGQTIAGVISAQSQLPAVAMAAATNIDQAALANSAAVAASGVAAFPGALQAAGHLLGVQTGNFGSTIIGVGNNIATESGNALNSIAVAGGSAANSAAMSASNAAQANSQVNQAFFNAVGKIFGGGMLA